MLNVATIILIGIAEPFSEKIACFMEFFNEATIMLCCYHLFLFTDFVPSPETRYTMGFSLIGATSLNLAGNILVMLGKTLLAIYEILRRKYIMIMHARHKNA
jgi:hypothetical protein